MPGHRWLAQAEFLAEQFLHFQAAFADRCESARGAGKFADQNPRLGLLAALDMPIDGGKPDRRLVAEDDRKRLLQMGPARHRRVAIFQCQAGETIAQLSEIPNNDIQRGPDLEHIGGVHDVLCGGAPMHIAAGLTCGFR